MKVIGIDPGKTTGWCVVVKRPGSAPAPIASGEWAFDEGIKPMLFTLLNHRPDQAVIEAVIKSGVMNIDKHVQIQSFERAMIACEMARPSKIPTAVQSPEITKKCPVEVPNSEVKGRHARDAYRVAAAWLLKAK
jgi:hypothetical protein